MFKPNALALAAACCVLFCASASLAAEGGGDRDIFNADIGNFIFTLIVFIVVVGILGKFAWKPLLTVLNEREKTIRESLESARHERAEAEKLLAEYKAQLERAREEATTIVDEGRRDAEVVRQRLQEEGRAAGRRDGRAGPAGDSPGDRHRHQGTLRSDGGTVGQRRRRNHSQGNLAGGPPATDR